MLSTVPTAGDRDQVTAVLPVFCTVAVNCCVCELLRLTVAGETVTLTGSCQVTVRRVFVMDVHRSQQKSAWFAHGSGWLWVAVTGVLPELLYVPTLQLAG